MTFGPPFQARPGPWTARIAAALAAALALGAPAKAGSSLETAIKATYLYKFAPFVGWPEGGAPAGGAFTLCVIGSDPFGPVLDSAVAGQSVDGRPIIVRRLEGARGGAGCQILYAGGSAQTASEAIRTVRGAPVLTVAEGQSSGAVIGFVVRDQRVRFVIDLHAAAENNLRISSKLLSLALEVQTGKP